MKICPTLFDSFKWIQEQTTKSDDIYITYWQESNKSIISFSLHDWSKVKKPFQIFILSSILFVWTEAFQPFQRWIYELTHGHTLQTYSHPSSRLRTRSSKKQNAILKEFSDWVKVLVYTSKDYPSFRP